MGKKTMRTLTAITVLSFLTSGTWIASAQTSTADNGRQPLYRVTIVSRTTKALNYGYLSAPTRIDFKGTPLMPAARGKATIETKRGATLINARFSDVPSPQQFGSQYLTYVVWAISPDGRAQNLGELSLDGSDSGKLSTSVPLQTFAMIVTAEPYYSVTQPSDVVVMENMVGPDTIGKVEEVNATYELLPRKSFTFEQAQQQPSTGKRISQAEYDATVAIYQAQNAIQIAEAQQAQRFAPERLARARQLLEQARGYPVNLSKEIVSMTREATQVAEDARLIAVKRAEAERIADEEKRIADARRAADAATAAQRVAERAEAERAAADRAAAERTAAQEVESQRARMAARPVPQTAPVPAASSEPRPPIVVDQSQFHRQDPQAAANRRLVLSALRNAFETTDTPRGLVVMIPDRVTESAALAGYMTRLAAAIAPYRDLHLEVEGHSDVPDLAATERMAETVRRALIAARVSPNIIVTRGYADTRPRTSNATAAGRAQNRRVEIVIAGDAIGYIPTWDRTYTVR
jgi:flagellar motor protein MotB